MIEFTERLRAFLARRERMLRSGSGTRAVMRCETRLVADQHSVIEAGGHVLDGDEPEDRGGTDTGPAPLEFLLASLGTCQQVMIGRNLALRDLRVESVRVRLKALFDRRGGHVDGTENRGVEEIRLEVLFESPESPEAVREVMEAVARQCYVLNTLKRAARIREDVLLNGERIARTEHGPG